MEEQIIFRTYVHVYLRGDALVDDFATFINLTPDQAAEYYVGKTFTQFYSGFEYKMTCHAIRCEYCQEYHYGEWKGCKHPDEHTWFHKGHDGKPVRGAA